MLEQWLANSVILAIVLWALLFGLDYALTLRGAKLYREIGKKYQDIEGSYELNPQFQKDIDQRRLISRKFLLLLLLVGALIAIEWFGFVQIFHVPAGYLFVLGVLYCRQFVVHMRHLQTTSLYRFLSKNPDALSGSLRISREYILKQSETQFALFGILFLIIAALTSSWFFLGGSVGCMGAAVIHRRWLRRFRAGATKGSASTLAQEAVSPDG